MNKRSYAFSVVMALALFVGSAAYAGYKATYQVSIVLGDRGSASGSLGSARSSADASQYIGCYVYSYSNPMPADQAGPTAYCMATNASGTFVYCRTRDSYLITQIQALKSDSYLHFSWYLNPASTAGTAPECTYVGTYTISWTDPK